MLYESIFYWENIVQAFLRDTTALFEEQTRQRQQYFEHWPEFWSKMPEPWLAAEDLTSIANTPWQGLIEVSEWTRQIVEQYAEVMMSGSNRAKTVSLGLFVIGAAAMLLSGNRAVQTARASASGPTARTSSSSAATLDAPSRSLDAAYAVTTAMTAP